MRWDIYTISIKRLKLRWDNYPILIVEDKIKVNNFLFKKLLFFYFNFWLISYFLRKFYLNESNYTVEITTLSPGRVHACSIRDRTVIVPIPCRFKLKWIVYDLTYEILKATHGTDSAWSRYDRATYTHKPVRGFISTV